MQCKARVAGMLCAFAVLAVLAPAASAGPACDEFDPFGPAGSARITLGPGDFTDEVGDEMRTFVATDSLGKIDVSVVSAVPRGSVAAVSAVPEISTFSPHYGERLKGIAIAVELAPHARPLRVVLALRQVCARHFRNTFLYY